MANNYEGIKTQKFGIEIEMTGLTRARAAKAVAQHFNTTVEHLGGSYDTYIIRATKIASGKLFLMPVSSAIKKMGLSQAIYIALNLFHQFVSMRIFQ